MADGYVENGKEFLAAIKQTGTDLFDYEAEQVLESSVETIITALMSYGITDERRIRRAFFWGMENGIKLATTAMRQRMEAERFADWEKKHKGPALVTEN